MSADKEESAALLAALAPREESVTIGGRVLTVRELSSASDTAAFVEDSDITFKLLVRSVFNAQGEQVFSDPDIPQLKQSSMRGLKALIDSVLRVNGFNSEDNEKKSDPLTSA